MLKTKKKNESTLKQFDRNELLIVEGEGIRK